MLTAGGLLWANIGYHQTQKKAFRITFDEQTRIFGEGHIWVYPYVDRDVRAYGWPIAAVFANPENPARFYSNREIHKLSIAIDVAIAIVAMVAVWFISEWLIRRAARQKAITDAS